MGLIDRVVGAGVAAYQQLVPAPAPVSQAPWPPDSPWARPGNTRRTPGGVILADHRFIVGDFGPLPTGGGFAGIPTLGTQIRGFPLNEDCDLTVNAILRYDAGVGLPPVETYPLPSFFLGFTGAALGLGPAPQDAGQPTWFALDRWLLTGQQAPGVTGWNASSGGEASPPIGPFLQQVVSYAPVQATNFGGTANILIFTQQGIDPLSCRVPAGTTAWAWFGCNGSSLAGASALTAIEFQMTIDAVGVRPG